MVISGIFDLALKACRAVARKDGKVNARESGMSEQRLRVYCSTETHTWVQKAADIAGLGTDAIRWYRWTTNSG
jgi:glutamate/tyrosine decarboxylase-like PLP-dependent enzyme